MKKDKKYKALETIAFGYSEGNISIDILIKACETYKKTTSLDDDLDYHILVAKSFQDCLNGLSQDAEIAKGIVPGQTKVVDGVMYVWSPTQSGSKQQYDWHVVKKTKSGVAIGKGNKLSAQEETILIKTVNALFPKDLSSLKEIKRLGGSTGAVLVEDVNKRQYVKKVNQSGISGHIEIEYAANQIYDLLGLKAKTCELYNENGENVLLSKYEYGLSPVTAKNYPEMAKGFIADVLLANWDVYKNSDNCLVDSAGRIVRVDNGGTFDFKARGQISSNKFTSNVVETFKGMVQYNGAVYSNLTEKDIEKQIKEIKGKKDEILAYMEEAGLSKYAKTMEQRINNLDKIIVELNKNKPIKNRKILPRKLKSAKEMYRDITDKELVDIRDEMMKELSIKNYDDAITFKDKSKHGWELLYRICKARGFDARPQVVDDDEYWKLVKQQGGDKQFFRGVGPNDDAHKSTNDIIANTLFEDDCFYGILAAWGQGIYVAQNAGKGNTSHDKNNYKNSRAWSEAQGYARGNSTSSDKGGVMKGVLSPDAKVISFADIYEKATNYVFSGQKNAALIRQVTKKINDLTNQINDKDDKINNFDKHLKQEIYDQHNFDESAYIALESTLDAIDWDKKDIAGDPDLPSWDDLVTKEIIPFVEKMGITVDKSKNLYQFTFPGTNEQFSISKFQYDGPYSLLKRNVISPSYNYSIERFKDYVQQNLIKKMDEELLEKRQTAKTQLSQFVKEKQDLETKRDGLKNDLQQLQSNMPAAKDSLLSQITNRNMNHAARLGIFAAAMGYDAIITHDSDTYKLKRYSDNYTVVLNRSKLIFSNEIDYL